MNEYDTIMLPEILFGENKEQRFSWTNAHVLRFLNIMMSKGNTPILAQLYKIWPEQIIALYRYWGWPEEEINNQLNKFDIENALREQFDAE